MGSGAQQEASAESWDVPRAAGSRLAVVTAHAPTTGVCPATSPFLGHSTKEYVSVFHKVQQRRPGPSTIELLP